jgi:hypothetical protein
MFYHVDLLGAPQHNTVPTLAAQLRDTHSERLPTIRVQLTDFHMFLRTRIGFPGPMLWAVQLARGWFIGRIRAAVYAG